MKTLKIALAILPLALLQTSYAGKPPTSQILTSPPLIGHQFNCVFHNASDHLIKVDAALIDAVGKADVDTFGLPSGLTVYHKLGGSGGVFDAVHCIISWDGQPDDITATHCSYHDSVATDGLIEGFACVDLK